MTPALLAYVIPLAVIFAAVVTRLAWDHHLARKSPAPPPPPAKPTPHARAHPPGLPRHDTRGINYSIARYGCGCTVSWDARGAVSGTFACPVAASLRRWEAQLAGEDA